MESYQIVDDIGFYNELTDSFFNLSPYAHMASSIDQIVFYLSEGRSSIIGIELVYSGYSTGVFHGVGYSVNAENKMEINCKKEHIEAIKGSFNGNRIASLLFHKSSKKVIGFVNSKASNEAQLTHFEFKKGRLLGFKVAFDKGLTFLSAIMAEEDKYIADDIRQVIATKTRLGKTFSDSIPFSLPNDIITSAILIQLEVYHDGNLLMGIQSTYRMTNNQLKTVLFGKKTSIGETIALKDKDDEFILSLTIRSGDMIDGLMLTTSKGQCLISGGIGGGPHEFSTNEIEAAYQKEQNSMRFIGFEGSANQVIHTLRLIFK